LVLPVVYSTCTSRTPLAPPDERATRWTQIGGLTADALIATLNVTPAAEPVAA